MLVSELQQEIRDLKLKLLAANQRIADLQHSDTMTDSTQRTVTGSYTTERKVVDPAKRRY